MQGQMSLFDFYDETGTKFVIRSQDEKPKQKTQEPKICSRCKYSVVWTIPGKEGIHCGWSDLTDCNYERKKTCGTCVRYRTVFGEEYKACFGFRQSPNVNEDTDAESCAEYIQRDELEHLTMPEIVDRITDATGIHFEKDKNDWEKWREDIETDNYTAKHNGGKITLGLGRFDIPNDQDDQCRYISVGYDYKTSGGGCPALCVDDAIHSVKKYIEYIAKEKDKMAMEKKTRKEGN